MPFLKKDAIQRLYPKVPENRLVLTGLGLGVLFSRNGKPERSHTVQIWTLKPFKEKIAKGLAVRYTTEEANLALSFFLLERN